MARIIEVKDTPARVKLRHGCIVVEESNAELLALPVEEIGTLILSHPAISCSGAALAGIAQGGGVVITCDSKYLPNGMLLPLCGNHIQTQRFRVQMEATVPSKKRIWKAIVQQKILNQSNVLLHRLGDDFGLSALVSQVKSGDTTNLEARAAKKYWSVLFGDKAYRRSDKNAAPNPLLDYGYAVLRATVARAICATGLHPSIGIHHRNKYNPYCLADDLMEPFRPCVDWVVAKMLTKGPCVPVESTGVRTEIIAAVCGPWTVRGEHRTIFDAAGRLAVSVLTSFQGKKDGLELPTMEL